MAVAWIAALGLSALVASPIPAAAPQAPAFADECAYPADWAPPFTHVYRLRNGATLVFVAVEHSRDPDDASHRMIRAAFERHHPDIALVEGVASSKSDTGAYQAFLVAAAARDAEHGPIQETLFTVRLAHDAGVRFSGWGLAPDEKYAGDVADGVALTDAVGAHLVWDKVDPADTLGGAAAIAREARYAARVKPVGAFDYPGWYRANYGAAFDPAHATPCAQGIAGQVFKDETRRRNVNLVAAIDRYATPGATVLVEGGANHWLALQPYLRSIATSWQ